MPMLFCPVFREKKSVSFTVMVVGSVELFRTPGYSEMGLFPIRGLSCWMKLPCGHILENKSGKESVSEEWSSHYQVLRHRFFVL